MYLSKLWNYSLILNRYYSIKNNSVLKKKKFGNINIIPSKHRYGGKPFLSPPANLISCQRRTKSFVFNLNRSYMVAMSKQVLHVRNWILFVVRENNCPSPGWTHTWSTHLSLRCVPNKIITISTASQRVYYFRRPAGVFIDLEVVRFPPRNVPNTAIAAVQSRDGGLGE